MKSAYSFVFSFLICFTGCKKSDFQNPFRKYNTVEGTLYYDHDFLPVSNVDLVLYAEKPVEGPKSARPIEYTQTNADGHFEFQYPEKDNIANLSIRHDVEGNLKSPFFATLAKGLAPNQDYDLKLFTEPFGILRIHLQVKQKPEVGDTLYIGGIYALEKIGFVDHNLAGSNKPGIKLTYPFTSNQIGPYNVWNDNDISTLLTVKAYWGIGKREYLNALEGDTLHSQDYSITGYPRVNTLSLVVN